jgi:lipopolysaccharide biosynthesis glycosyltransferase
MNSNHPGNDFRSGPDRPAAAVHRSPGEQRGHPAVVLICDSNYFLPTFSTALSAEFHTRASGARIYLFVVDVAEEWVRRFDGTVAETRIVVRPATLPELGSLARFHRDRYLPPIALARFWIDGLLDPEIDRFLYVDGDTMVDGELDSLLRIRPPDEGLMAVSDFISIFADEFGLKKRTDLAYLAGIGCRPEEYFNSGVIYCGRRAWREIVPSAVSFLVDHPELCRASDQSALNHATVGRVAGLPLGYNYQSEHMMVLDPRAAGFQPVIWHFTGGPKPWNETGWPWGEEFNAFYRRAERALEGCAIRTPVPPEAQTRAGRAHRLRTRSRMRWVYPWRRIWRRRKILRLLSSGTLPREATTPRTGGSA